DRVENLVGGAGPDVFNFGDGPGLFDNPLNLGSIDGRGGKDVLNFSASPRNVFVTLTAAGVTDGFDGRVSSGLSFGGPYVGSFANIDKVVGSSLGTMGFFGDELSGTSVPATWTISDRNAGNIGGADRFDFEGFESLHGGTPRDTFRFLDGAGVDGRV